MKKLFIVASLLIIESISYAQSSNDTLVLRDIPIDKDAPAKMIELSIPSNNKKLQGFIYMAAGKGMHPTVFYCMGFQEMSAI